MQNQATTTTAVMERERPVIAIVVPCYNEQEVLPGTIKALTGILGRLAELGLASADSFLLLVNDGSRDNTWKIISETHAVNPAVRGISLAHNRGQQMALLAGLMTAKDLCDAAITIDADLQDSPEAVIEMVKRYREGADIVYGVRDSRQTDTWFKRNSARAFYRLQHALGLKTIYDHSDFRLMDRATLDILAQYGEKNLFIRGIIPDIGLSTAIVKYDRSARTAGESKYPLSKMIAFSIDGITSFTAKPMQMIFTLGFIILIVDLIIALWVLIAYFRGAAISGWSSLMLSVWFLGSLILMALGIIGEYIGKIFIEVKNRPRYNIAEKLL